MPPSATPSRSRKIAIVGSSAVGKSSITVQFVEKHFVESYYPTIENQFFKPITFKGVEYTTEIIDTAGQDEFSIMNQKHFIGIHGYMLIYSITSMNSFEMIKIIKDKILNALGTDEIPICIVGNKCDLESQRQVTFQQGQDLAKSFNAAFIETSAKNNENIDKAFEALISQIDLYFANESNKNKEKNCVVQ